MRKNDLYKLYYAKTLDRIYILMYNVSIKLRSFQRMPVGRNNRGSYNSYHLLYYFSPQGRFVSSLKMGD